MANLTHWIDGKHVEGTSGRFNDVYNPATGEVVSQVPLASTAAAKLEIGAEIVVARRTLNTRMANVSNTNICR